MTDTGPSPEVRALVHRRSEGVCERCRRSMATDVHHRRARGSGGSTAPGINAPTNLVDLCRACHEWVEAHFTQAVDTGWKISLTYSPTIARTTVLTQLDGTELLLDDDGSKWVKVVHDNEPPSWF